MLLSKKEERVKIIPQKNIQITAVMKMKMKAQMVMETIMTRKMKIIIVTMETAIMKMK